MNSWLEKDRAQLPLIWRPGQLSWLRHSSIMRSNNDADPAQRYQSCIVSCCVSKDLSNRYSIIYLVEETGTAGDMDQTARDMGLHDPSLGFRLRSSCNVDKPRTAYLLLTHELPQIFGVTHVPVVDLSRGVEIGR